MRDRHPRKRIHATRHCKTAPRKAPYLLAKAQGSYRNLLRRFDEILDPVDVDARYAAAAPSPARSICSCIAEPSDAAG